MQWPQKWKRVLAWITSKGCEAKGRGRERRSRLREKHVSRLLAVGAILFVAAIYAILERSPFLYPTVYLLTAGLVFSSSRLLGPRAAVVSGCISLLLLVVGSARSPYSATGSAPYLAVLLAAISVHALWMLSVTCLVLWIEEERRKGAVLTSKAERADRRLAQAIHKRDEVVALLAAQTAEAALQRTSMMAMNTTLQQAQAELEAQYLSLQAANARHATLATTDGMTGLANHRAFQEHLNRQMVRANRSNAPLSLMLLDVDRFKLYNDAFGHPAGDEVLKLVGRILQAVVREGDFPARYGGEEFAVILPDSPFHMAVQVAERVRLAVEAEQFPNRPVTISIGVALSKPGETAPSLIQRADVALYEAKSAGRNCVVVFQPDMMESAEEIEGASSIIPADLIQHTNDENHIWMVEAENRSHGVERGGRWHREERKKLPEAIAFISSEMPSSGGLEGILQEPPALILSELLSVMDRRHAQPAGHTERVARYALRLAGALAAQYDEQRESRPLLPRITQGDIADIAFGALVHDIGKSGIPDAILRKSGELTEDEWRQIRRHPLVGAELISGCHMLSRALPVVRFHHERWDGTGYPQGLAGDAIPLGARIFALCDTLETLLSDKPYRDRMDFAAARQEIVQASGTQFDPDIVQAFLKIPEGDWMEIDGLHYFLPYMEYPAKAA